MYKELKELKCLYRISHLVEEHRTHPARMLQGIVDLLPAVWQYPEICCARLVLPSEQYQSVGFQLSDWKQSAQVRTDGQVVGNLEVFYIEEMSELDEGPFLGEERGLIDSVAERIGSVLERIAVESQLDTERAALKERLKELGCLYEISELVERHRDSLPNLLRGIVGLLPSSWQYPEICRAYITLYDQRYETEVFQESQWRQSVPIRVQGERVGAVEVFYLEEMPKLAEGPFLKEERDLINAVAERVGNIVERSQVDQQLKVERSALQEANDALRRLLTQIEEEKTEIYRSIDANVESVIAPLLQALASEIPERQRQYISLLRKHLDALVAPFTHRVCRVCTNLTPVEIEICNMIRDGMTTKEIARVRHVAPATVSKQRERIRRKLNLEKTDANLAAHLQVISTESN